MIYLITWSSFWWLFSASRESFDRIRQWFGFGYQESSQSLPWQLCLCSWGEHIYGKRCGFICLCKAGHIAIQLLHFNEERSLCCIFFSWYMLVIFLFFSQLFWTFSRPIKMFGKSFYAVGWMKLENVEMLPFLLRVCSVGTHHFVDKFIFCVLFLNGFY